MRGSGNARSRGASLVSNPSCASTMSLMSANSFSGSLSTLMSMLSKTCSFPGRIKRSIVSLNVGIFWCGLLFVRSWSSPLW